MNEILSTSIMLLEGIEKALEGNPSYLDDYYKALNYLYALDLLLTGKLPTKDEIEVER